jgi:hypothetical protein
VALDFWNNPIVVSAFRVKYRRGGPFFIATVYLIALAGLGALFWNYDNPTKLGPWHRNYFLVLFGIQYALSALIAVGTTAASIRSEVVSRTLDFQRIAAVSPRDILLGKLLGEPALAYLLALATVPLTLFCVLSGLHGVSIAVWLLLYLNLASSTFLFGSMSMIQRLEPSPGKNTPSGSVGGGMLAILLISQYVAGSIALASGHWSASAAGLITPIPALAGVFYGDPWWRYSLHFFGLELPLLILTPISQLLGAYLCFRIMVRRLINPLNTALSKKLAYLVLVVVDIFAAAVVFGPFQFGLEYRVVTLCLVHLLASLWLVELVTPWRECLQSWVWRFRGRANWFMDSLLGERSENSAVVLAFALIGAIMLAVVVLATGINDQFAEFDQSKSTIILAGSTMVLLILAAGIFEQFCTFIAGRDARFLYVAFIAIMVLPLHIFGAAYRNELALSFTPTAHFAAWFTGAQLPAAPLFVTYTAILVFSWIVFRRRLAQFVRSVDHKLAQMGVKVREISPEVVHSTPRPLRQIPA